MGSTAVGCNCAAEAREKFGVNCIGRTAAAHKSKLSDLSLVRFADLKPRSMTSVSSVFVDSEIAYHAAQVRSTRTAAVGDAVTSLTRSVAWRAAFTSRRPSRIRSVASGRRASAVVHGSSAGAACSAISSSCSAASTRKIWNLAQVTNSKALPTRPGAMRR